MAADRELERIARAEAGRRADAILQAIRGKAPSPDRWAIVFRHAHSLAGIAPDLDAEVARSARRLTEIVADSHGGARAPDEAGEAEAKRLADAIGARAAALGWRQA